jgi:hypothetical protein
MQANQASSDVDRIASTLPFEERIGLFAYLEMQSHISEFLVRPSPVADAERVWVTERDEWNDTRLMWNAVAAAVQPHIERKAKREAFEKLQDFAASFNADMHDAILTEIAALTEEEEDIDDDGGPF